jgi:hypothetical protein
MNRLSEFLRRPTLLVVGAGASRDIGAPLWGDLRRFLQEPAAE